MTRSSTSPLTDKRRDLGVFALSFVLPLACVAACLDQLGAFVIDDAYISFRYARNLVEGHGLVYNAGERVEGYTNFLWTMLLALVIKLGGDAVIWSKALGAASIGGVMALSLVAARRFEKGGVSLPAFSPWLVASGVSFQAHATLGLEGGLFAFLLLAGVLLLDQRSPWFGVAFGLAALCRPEGPAFAAVAIVLNLRRGDVRRVASGAAVFALIFGAYLLWRHSYYGHWLPNTLAAKTGDVSTQFSSGFKYITDFAATSGVALGLSVAGVGLALWDRGKGSRLALTCAGFVGLNLAYVLVLGADWMPGFRYLMPLEPFAYLLVDFALRRVLAWRVRTVAYALAALLAFGFWQRAVQAKTSIRRMQDESASWREHAGTFASWMAVHAAPDGEIALGDIGEVGWVTRQPIYDLLGLVTPAVGKLPGGYGGKDGKLLAAAFYARKPEYLVTIGNCKTSHFHVMRVMMQDPRFAAEYEFLHNVRLGRNNGWCTFQRSHPEKKRGVRTVLDFESTAGWTRTGSAFAEASGEAERRNQQRVIGNTGKFANSFATGGGDLPVGTLESPPFTLDADAMRLRVGGGMGLATRVELRVDDEAVFVAFGDETEDLRPVTWDLRGLRGKMAVLRVVDEAAGAWGHVMVDEVGVFDWE